MLYSWHSALLDLLPAGVLRILDAPDVFTDKAARMAKAGIPQEWFNVSAKEEARGLARFDTVLAIQDFEAQHYRALASTHVVTVGHFLPIIETGRPPAEPILLIIGSDNDVNVHGVRWFLAEVWPAALAGRPDARLRGWQGVRASERDGRRGLCGVVDDLCPVYSGSSLVLNPLRGGTGLQIKGAEAPRRGELGVPSCRHRVPPRGSNGQLGVAGGVCVGARDGQYGALVAQRWGGAGSAEAAGARVCGGVECGADGAVRYGLRRCAFKLLAHVARPITGQQGDVILRVHPPSNGDWLIRAGRQSGTDTMCTNNSDHRINRRRRGQCDTSFKKRHRRHGLLNSAA